MFHSSHSFQIGEPVVDRTQFTENIVVDVDFKSEDLAFLKDGLRGRVVATGLTVFIA